MHQKNTQVAKGTQPAEANAIVEKVNTLTQDELNELNIACVQLKKRKKYPGNISLRTT